MIAFGLQVDRIGRSPWWNTRQTFTKRDDTNPRNVAVPYNFRELAKPDRPLDFRHGTLNTYAHHHCRCDECKTAWNTYQLKLQRKRRYVSSLQKCNPTLSLFNEDGHV